MSFWSQAVDFTLLTPYNEERCNSFFQREIKLKEHATWDPTRENGKLVTL